MRMTTEQKTNRKHFYAKAMNLALYAIKYYKSCHVSNDCRSFLLFALIFAFVFPRLALCTADVQPSIGIDQLGEAASEKTGGDLQRITATKEGAEIVCALQRLQGGADANGLWLRSTVDGQSQEKFSLRSVALGRSGGQMQALPIEGDVEVVGETAKWLRQEVVEEFSVSADGVRQDFIVHNRPDGEGELAIAVEVSGATLRSVDDGVLLIPSASSRELIYNRLNVYDSHDNRLNAWIETSGSDRMLIFVDDNDAIYPLRIDPTISDSDWSALGEGMAGVNDRSVDTLAIDRDGNLYAGGDFTSAGGNSADYIACWNDNSWTALDPRATSPVLSLATDASGNLYAGGGLGIARWDGHSWSELGDGVFVLPYVLTVDMEGNLYAGGLISSAGGMPANGIARWDGISWSALGDGVNDSVTALAIDSLGNLYVGGYFTSAGGVSANHIACWDGNSWSALDSGIKSSYGSRVVEALAVDSSGNLYVGGKFETAGGASVGNIACWDGTSWSALGSGINNGRVNALTFDAEENLYVGGTFTSAGGVSANFIACWDGNSWSGLGSGMSSTVNSLLIDNDGNLYAGGSFTIAGDTSANRIAVLDISSNGWGNSRPTLSWPSETGYDGQRGVAPISGTAGGEFTYRIVYRDKDGDAPLDGFPVVWIDRGSSGDYYPMEPVAGGSYTSGKTYTYPTTLDAGYDYFYSFSAYDTHDAEASGPPAIGRQDGPIVEELGLPVCSILEFNLDFSWSSDQKQLIVNNTGGGTLTGSMSISEGGEYFTIDRTSISLSNGDSDSILISCDMLKVIIGQEAFGTVKLDTNVGTYYVTLNASAAPEKVYSNAQCNVYKLSARPEGVSDDLARDMWEWGVNEIVSTGSQMLLGFSTGPAGWAFTGFSFALSLDDPVKLVPVLPVKEQLIDGDVSLGTPLGVQVHVDLRERALGALDPSQIILKLDADPLWISSDDAISRVLLTEAESSILENGYYYIIQPTSVLPTEGWNRDKYLRTLLGGVRVVDMTMNVWSYSDQDDIFFKLKHPDDAAKEVGISTGSIPKVSGPFLATQAEEHSLLLDAGDFCRFAVGSVYGDLSNFKVRFGAPDMLAMSAPVALASGDGISASSDSSISPSFEVQGVDGVVEFEAPYSGTYTLEVVPDGVATYFIASVPVELSWDAIAGAEYYKLLIQKSDGSFSRTEWVEAPDTSWTPPYEMPAGDYEWYLAAWTRAGGVKDWSAANQFLVRRDYPSAAPVLFGPVGMLDDTIRPEFSWGSVAKASWYKVIITKDGVEYKTHWTHDSEFIPATDLHSGSYRWWVVGWGAKKYGPWSDAAEFVIPALKPYAAPIQSGPEGTISSTRTPTFSWSSVDRAGWYRIYLTRNGKLYFNKWVRDVTSFTPADDLPGGEYSWWIVGWGSDGYGPWSERQDFTIPLGVPAMVHMVAPVGELDSVADALEFEWSADEKATWYHVWINRVGSGKFAAKWLQAPTTSWTPAKEFGGGDYRWWVAAWNEHGYGKWSIGAEFSVPSMKPGKIDIVSPSGSYNSTVVPYTWAADPKASWYQLFVMNDGVAIINEWLNPSTASDTITWTSNTHRYGKLYKWWVRAWGGDGIGPWSDAASFRVSDLAGGIEWDFEGAGIPDEFEAISGTWSIENGRLTGTWSESSAYSTQGNCILKPEFVEEDYWALELVGSKDDNLRLILYNSAYKMYRVRFYSKDGNLTCSSEYLNGSGRPSGKIFDEIVTDIPFDRDRNVAIKRFGSEFSVLVDNQTIETFTDTIFDGDLRPGLGAYGECIYRWARLSDGI